MFKTNSETNKNKVCCELCKGKCKNKDNFAQQRAVRKLIKETPGYEETPLPSRCPASQDNGRMISHCLF